MTTSSATTATTTSKPAASSAAAAISAMLAFHACPTQAFQPSFLAPRAQVTNHAGFWNPVVVPDTATMRCSSPWEGRMRNRGRRMQPFRRGLEGWPAAPRFGPAIFAPEGVFEDCATLQVRDPEVSETDGKYKLTFDMPTEVDEDGLDVSVSGRLLTVTARVTREASRGGNPSGGPPSRGGWVSRSSRTDSVSRSFVLPEGISTSEVAASWITDGKVEVKFNKDTPAPTTTDTAGSAAGASTTTATPPQAVSTASRDSKQTSSAGDAINIDADNKSPTTPTASSSAGYLSSLSSARKTSAADDSADLAAEAQQQQSPPADPDATTSAPSTASSAEAGRRQPRSVLGALDQEFGEFAKAMWGENVLRFPTEEEVEAARDARAKRVEAVREARAKKISAFRRATMAVDIWETDENNGASYVVKIALPEGATRDDVKLAITPDNALRVSFSAEGRRSVFKDVRLPADAVFSEISAKFEAENEEEGEGKEVRGEDVVVDVSSVKVVVGKAVPPQPRRVDIM